MEVVIFPEMITAGVEAYRDGKETLSDEELALAVYLAMQAVFEVYRLQSVTVH